MKKYAIIAVVFVLGLASLIGYSILRSAERNAYSRAVSDHIVYLAQHTGEFPVAGDGDDAVQLSYDNARRFTDAAERAAAEFRLLPPDVDDLPVVTVRFPDDAVICVYDAGRSEEGKDVAYISHTWRGDTDWFTLSGFNTMERARACTSLEGFGSPNYPAGTD